MPGPPGVRVRPMVAGDIPQVRLIEQEAFPELGRGTPFHTELESKLARYLVAVRPSASGDSDEVVGYAGLWFVLDEAHITALAVRPDVRRQGIGRLLLLAAFGAALERESTLLTLEVRASNRAAQHLYQTLGLRKVGVRRGYYSDNREDAWLMTVEGLDSAGLRRRLEDLRAQHAPCLPPFPVPADTLH